MSVAIGPGVTFAGYRVESLVARGGMGVVYRATDLSLGRQVALKLIAPELAEDARFRTRFLKESRLAASLDHPNVVPIYEAREADGQLYLAMRYVEGSDLKAVLRRHGRLTPERAVAVLSQVAAALDAAHRRGLVHRDVKPGNVLIDQDDHAYLTDFGVTKQVGGASTDTGQLVGTLDYLAPEQIRGEKVDARTDGYALACVLYECLAGAPPFHRATEAETLWAHMQEEPAALREHRTLTPVLKRALAKQRDDRYGSCAELIDEARRAVGLDAPPARRVRLSALARRRRSVLAAGLAVLAATAAAGIALTGGGPRPPPAGSGVLALDPADGRIGAFAPARTAPGNIAVGAGAVWALNSDDETVSRIDPRTKRVVKTFKTGGRPSDLAAGAGALWVGNGGGRDVYHTVSVSRIDPRSARVTRTVKLPHHTQRDQGPSVGVPQLAVGAGGVWAIDPDPSISRLDPATGKRVATIDTRVLPFTIAAGDAGVWFLSWERRAVMRIDPRTNRLAETIRLPADSLAGIAVGAGAIWAISTQDGLLWRVQPGSSTARSIDVGVGVSYVAFGDGAVWTGNYMDGMVTRVDPRTNTVTNKVPVGATQALGAGAGSAWVSVAAGTSDGALPASSCSEVSPGGAKPDVLIASDFSLQGDEGGISRALVDAIRLVLKDHGFRAGRYVVGYQSCDDSTNQTGNYEQRLCAANAYAMARAKQVVAALGPFTSFCAQPEIPILNRAPGGPLALVSPSTTYPGLTRGRPLVSPSTSLRGEPGVYYPTRTRNFFRLTARDDLSGVADALLAKQLRLRGVYLVHDSGQDIALTEPFRRAAARIGVNVVGSESYDDTATSYRALADRIARSRADGVLIGGNIYYGGDRLLRTLRARLGPRAAVLASDGPATLPGFLPISQVLESAGRAARGLYLASPFLPPAAVDLTPAQHRLLQDLGDPASEEYVLQAMESADVVLGAIARSDGTRASVLHELAAARVKNGVLGSFRFDRYGDITPAKVTILRVTGRTPLNISLPRDYQGATIDRVITVPASLAG
jgi:ABC-type branched-subunit amino acid transport system substrate-binding protein/tRNA A-37 threonylcarbamoyl transferase component Bud32/DNA-binding beta-propeller fold protein YncE